MSYWAMSALDIRENSCYLYARNLMEYLSAFWSTDSGEIR